MTLRGSKSSKKDSANNETTSDAFSKPERKKSLKFLKGKQKGVGCPGSNPNEPPILTLEFNRDDDFDAPVGRKGIDESTKEFVSAAEAAVKSQLDSRDETCCRLPPDSMSPTEALNVFKKSKVSL